MPNGFGAGNEVGSSKAGAPPWSSTHLDTAGGHGSAPDAAAPPQREIQAPAGASPGFWVVISATPSSCHRGADGHRTWHHGRRVSPMLGRQCGRWGRGIGAAWQKSKGWVPKKIK